MQACSYSLVRASCLAGGGCVAKGAGEAHHGQLLRQEEQE
jgi:hypothetical protein